MLGECARSPAPSVAAWSDSRACAACIASTSSASTGTRARSSRCTTARGAPATDSDSDGLEGFAEAEAAKRWLLFGLLELGLPVVGWRDREGGLGFDLLSSTTGEPVATGHAGGIVTLDLAETDDARREQRREELGEPYRTVLGHLRHEIGHYYQDILVPEGSAARDQCRAIVGDDRADYSAALDRQ